MGIKWLFVGGLVLGSSTVSGQISIERAQEVSRQFHLSSYSYHEQFIGHVGYGAPVILTSDGGAAAFGDGDEGPMLIKFDTAGRVQWKKTFSPKGTEMELQSVVQDKNGDFFVFALVYGISTYRGGCERAAFINRKGTVVWDKFIGTCNLLNSPTVSYIRALPDGRISLRGHVVKQSPPKGQDPTYLFWEGWLNTKGVMTQKAGAVIDWKKTEEWQSRLKPEN
jgi:hypothetical protein